MSQNAQYYLPNRIDFDVIAKWVQPNSSVLDVGCGDGTLLALLQQKHTIDGRGVELSQQGVDQSLARGLSVVQGDADQDLVYYANQSFDYVILSQTLQATRDPKQVMQHLLRIGRKVIVSIPNFGYWRVRMSLMFRGRMPVTKELPFSWYNTPNIHFCTLRDFVELVHECEAKIEEVVTLDRHGQKVTLNLPWGALNLFGQQAVFLLKP